MLKIHISKNELWDEVNERFIKVEDQDICLEHSLVSLSKWESKWHKYFLDNKNISSKEMLDYIRCMTLTQNVNEAVYSCLSEDNLNQIKDYITDSMTATWFNDSHKKEKNKEIITSEIIYYWMISLQIPFECQKWHLNRLLTLIRVCNEKNNPKKKMTTRELIERNKMLNEARKKSIGSKG